MEGHVGITSWSKGKSDMWPITDAEKGKKQKKEQHS